jgi:succinoglycan biosynthesis protein ExoA
MAVQSVDVLISTFNEESHLPRCLEAVLGQDYDGELRVILADGGSTDRTVAIAEEFAARDPRLTVLADGVRRNLPAALNVGLDECRGDLVAKVDGHGWPERDFIGRAVADFDAEPELGCVGGRPVQEGETKFGRALALARGSRFGVGGSEYAGTSSRAYVDSVQCGVYRRDVLEQVGRFDPEMNFGEDDELNWRIVKAGFRILLDTDIRFHYVTRGDWGGAYRQYRNYGYARVGVARAHPGYMKAYHLAPAIAAVGAAGLAVLGLRSRMARRTLVAGAAGYAGAAAGFAVAASKGEESPAPRVATAFFALHAGYAVGMLKALVRLPPRR